MSLTIRPAVTADIEICGRIMTLGGGARKCLSHAA